MMIIAMVSLFLNNKAIAIFTRHLTAIQQGTATKRNKKILGIFIINI